MDTGGLVLKVVVHPADVSDRAGAMRVLDGVAERFPGLRRLWVDAGYRGSLTRQGQEVFGLTVTVVQRPRRWMRWPDD